MRDSFLNIIHGSEAVRLYGDGSAFVERNRVLVAADLHLGRSETLQDGGVPVPGVGKEDLARLGHRAETVGADSVVILGDLLHGPAALTEGVESMLKAWVRAVDRPVHLVRGNHDRVSQARIESLGIEVAAAALSVGSLELVHDAAEAPDGRPVIAGHTHPCVRLVDRGERLRLPVFVQTQAVLTVPAYGTFTGCSVVPRERTTRLYVLVDGDIIPLPGEPQINEPKIS